VSGRSLWRPEPTPVLAEAGPWAHELLPSCGRYKRLSGCPLVRKGYPAEFRRRALDLVAAGKPVREVARLLEVSDQSIYTWRRQELIDRGELPGLTSAEREELRAARQRIRELEKELGVRPSC
jgi:transposase